MERESLKRFERLRSLYTSLRPKLLKDPFLMEKLPLLEKAISKTRRAFEENGSFEFCAQCAAKGEKCCGLGLEWKVSPAEFFLNLLLCERKGKELSYNLERKEDCLFLGENGCLLPMPPLFCRNFFCEKLSDFLGEERLKAIQNAMEDEANLSFVMCEYLIKNYLFNLKEEE